MIVVHGVREVNELAYQDYVRERAAQPRVPGRNRQGQADLLPTVTREPFRNQGRITDLIENGTFPANIGLPPLDPLTDRVMLCGSPPCWPT